MNNHERNRDDEIPGMSISFKTIESCTDIPDIMKTEELRKKMNTSLFWQRSYSMVSFPQKLRYKRIYNVIGDLGIR